MSQNDNMDRSLAVLAGAMFGSSILGIVALSALIAGERLNGEHAAAECRQAATGYLDSAKEGTLAPSRERALDRACGGPHAFLVREVLNPLRGARTCETAVAEYLRARRDGANTAENDRRQRMMDTTCKGNEQR